MPGARRPPPASRAPAAHLARAPPEPAEKSRTEPKTEPKTAEDGAEAQGGGTPAGPDGGCPAEPALRYGVTEPLPPAWLRAVSARPPLVAGEMAAAWGEGRKGMRGE